MYYQSTGPLTTTGTTTTLALPTLKIPTNTLFPSKSVLLVISNPTASAQTITSGSLLLKDTVGGVASTITYALSAVSIAAGSNQSFLVQLTSGLLANPTLSVTYGSNPSAGTLAVEAAWNQNIGPSGSGSGTVTSLSSPNSTINVGSPTTTPTLDINLANANTWTGLQTFGNGTNPLNVAVPNGQIVLNSAATNSVLIGSGISASIAGNQHVVIGFQAGASLTSSPTNTFIGWKAGNALATGSGANVFIGTGAGQLATNVDTSVFIGENAGQTANGNSGSVYIGQGGGQANGGISDVGIGANCLANGHGGNTGNVAVGPQVAFSNGGQRIAAIGEHALLNASNCNYSVALGGGALYADTNGTGNIGIGWLSNYACSLTCGTLALTTGSALNIGQYYYKCAYVLGGNTSSLSLSSDAPVAITTTSGNQSVVITSIPVWTGPITCTARKIYRTKVGAQQGGTPYSWYLLTTIADNTTTTYTDTTPDSSLVTQNVDPSNSLIIGYFPTEPSNAGADGSYSAYKSNQIAIGAQDQPYTECWIGGGVFSTTPSDILISATGGNGSNVAGANMILSGGPGTGTGASGALILKAAKAGASGSIWNAVSEVARLTGTGLGIGVTPNAVYSLDVANAVSSGSAIHASATGGGTINGVLSSVSGSNPSTSYAVRGDNTTATGTVAAGIYGTINGNGTTSWAVKGDASSTGATSYGVAGSAQNSTNSAKVVGVSGIALNSGTTPVQVGGYFALRATVGTLASCGILVDNGAISSPVALFQAAGVTKLTIDSSGNVVQASGGTLTLGNSATTGLSAGVLAASTNASIVITDNAGQAYRIPCII